VKNKETFVRSAGSLLGLLTPQANMLPLDHRNSAENKRTQQKLVKKFANFRWGSEKNETLKNEQRSPSVTPLIPN